MDAQLEMPRWKCHKEVWALKIDRIETEPDNSARLYPVDTRYAPFYVFSEWLNRHNPTAPGYYVVYKDGYNSWSPVEAFEDGYSLA